MKFIYPAVFHEEKDGKYKGYFPDLECCYGEGDTIDDAIDCLLYTSNLDIFTCLYLCKKLTCDFFTSNIFMKQNSRSGMGAFSCVQKFTIFLCKRCV